MNVDGATVLVDGNHAWVNATVVWAGNNLQVLVPNGTGGSDIVETFYNADRKNSIGATHHFSSSSELLDSDGDEFTTVTVIRSRKCGTCPG